MGHRSADRRSNESVDPHHLTESTDVPSNLTHDDTSNPMTYLLRTSCGLILGVLLWTALVPASTAQQTRTLTIRDGTIQVDGQTLSDDQIPSDLDLEGITAQYQFMGIERPVIELNGRLFAINDGLKQVSEDEVQSQESSVILQEISAGPAAPRTRTSGTVRDPQRQYLNDVQKANRELYNRLVRERTMEQEAQNLAHIIRMLPEGSSEREAKADTLRSLLNEIFELKQENRREEIRQVEDALQALRQRLQEREAMRDEIIQHRMRELTGQ